MNVLELTCKHCGIARARHTYASHDFEARDDQQVRPTERELHYAIRQRRVVPIATPAVGVDWRAVVPNGSRWSVYNFVAQLLTSAAVANRVPHFVMFDPDGNQILNMPAPGNQLATTTALYSGSCDSSNSSFDNATVLSLPQPMYLLQGWSLRAVTTALDAGDQWSKLFLLVEEWLNF